MFTLKGRVSWRLVRAHLCTLAVAVSFNSTWRVPAEALRHGGVPYLLALSAGACAVALPAALLQLAVGQLSQQDAVGMWSAVPFFRGVGYMRLLISFVGSLYTIVYVALTATSLLYSISRNSCQFWECAMSIPESNGELFYDQTCPNSTLLAPVREEPEYFIALALIIIVLWIIFPFILYNPIKLMKRIFYTLGPSVFLLLAIVAFSVGTKNNLLNIHQKSEWLNFLESKMWYSAVTQALLSCQVTGGYLISAGGSTYSGADLSRSALAIVVVNVAAGWLGTLFWFGVAAAPAATLLAHILRAAERQEHVTAWPLLVLLSLFFSGIVTMLTLLYPLYDRFRRVGGQGWRIFSFSSSLLGAAAAIAVLSGGIPVLALLEDTIVPILISITAILEIFALVYIYGWKALVEDVEFLTGRALGRLWVVGWWVAPAGVLSVAAWRLAGALSRPAGWRDPPWEAIGLVATSSGVFAIFIGFATITVVKQVQYDIFGKIKCSFKPSRHWGPRDPITHYDWLARRAGAARGGGALGPYQRRQLGQLAGGLALPTQHRIHDETITNPIGSTDKKLSNSDDWLYTGNRKEYLSETCVNAAGKMRSKSMDSPFGPTINEKVSSFTVLKTSAESSYCATPPEVVGSLNEHSDVIK